MRRPWTGILPAAHRKIAPQCETRRPAAPRRRGGSLVAAEAVRGPTVRGSAGAVGTAGGVIALPGTAIAPAAGQGEHGQPKRQFLIAPWAPGTGKADFAVSAVIEGANPGAAGTTGRQRSCVGWGLGSKLGSGRNSAGPLP